MVRLARGDLTRRKSYDLGIDQLLRELAQRRLVELTHSGPLSARADCLIAQHFERPGRRPRRGLRVCELAELGPQLLVSLLLALAGLVG